MRDLSDEELEELYKNAKMQEVPPIWEQIEGQIPPKHEEAHRGNSGNRGKWKSFRRYVPVAAALLVLLALIPAWYVIRNAGTDTRTDTVANTETAEEAAIAKDAIGQSQELGEATEEVAAEEGTDPADSTDAEEANGADTISMPASIPIEGPIPDDSEEESISTEEGIDAEGSASTEESADAEGSTDAEESASAEKNTDEENSLLAEDAPAQGEAEDSDICELPLAEDGNEKPPVVELITKKGDSETHTYATMGGYSWTDEAEDGTFTEDGDASHAVSGDARDSEDSGSSSDASSVWDDPNLAAIALDETDGKLELVFDESMVSYNICYWIEDASCGNADPVPMEGDTVLLTDELGKGDYRIAVEYENGSAEYFFRIY